MSHLDSIFLVIEGVDQTQAQEMDKVCAYNRTYPVFRVLIVNLCSWPLCRFQQNGTATSQAEYVRAMEGRVIRLLGGGGLLSKR